ncbi:sugar ABC transporter permease [Haloferax sp. Atlit-12N]|jgi:ABC-type sugar transport system permease subunit|uniref:Binding-protein-dependent transport systems inner membrane component n=2 Tax=Haloferacaceae TaxID=1644056 RepID=M0JHV6_9EURY|nr:sugar ABC transporter permease [Haloferax sp. ATB1]EMA07948.1 binding-protein-dependent transport systems inner membrane component [Haloferax denitrificans ATCC 35960]MBC9987918.1 sugar ABC transporter permease [Haloferax sp. AS1]RDZ59780.1 sugar ABC transporter permease [Haloferax sp. Atlit-12N]
MATQDISSSPLSPYVAEFKRFVSDTWLGYAMVLPAVIMLGAIIVYPTLRGIQLAFFEVSLLNPEQMTFVGLSNFGQMLSDATFKSALWHTVLLTAVAVSLQYLLGLGLALALKEKVPGAGFFRSASMITWVLPGIVMVIIFRFLVQPDFGPANIVLAKLGLETTYWFGRPGVAFPLIVVMHVWRNVPFYAIALMAAMKSIPETQYEAARLDGAGPLQAFRYITLPQISYVSMIMIVLHVIFTFNNFDIVYLSTGGGPLGNTEVMSTYIYKQAFEQYALGYGASMALVMLIIMMAFTVVYVRLEARD